MFFNTTKIFTELATIKANTANHKAHLEEFKNDFKEHVKHEDKTQQSTSDKIDAIKCQLQMLECPYEIRIVDLEKKQIQSGKDIASLKTARKYNYLSGAGLYAIAGIILKKIYH